MYKTEFDAKRIVEKCVDAIRENTDGSITECQQSLISVLQLLGPHFGSETFSELQNQASVYQVDVENSFDRKVLNNICENLYDIFMEKQELSFSAEQDDVNLLKNLQLFCEITRKTDNRIPFSVVSQNNFDWMIQLLNVLQMDQDPVVKKSIVETIHVFVTACEEKAKQMLMNTQLVIILVKFTSQSISSVSPSEKELILISLKLLGTLFTTEIVPQLEHLDYINSEYISRLYHFIDLYDEADAMNLCSNLHHILYKNGLPSFFLLEPFLDDSQGCSKFAIVLINEINRESTMSRIEFLYEILNLGSDVLKSLFYDNDMRVLANILVREMINQSIVEIRSMCHKCLIKLKDEKILEDAEILELIEHFDT